MSDNPALLQKAKEYAFLLLKFRLRSEKEIYQRLKKKKFPEEIINQTILFLEDKRFIDDSFFAKAWAESRIKKRLGLRRIKQELNLKGISKEIVDREINAIKKEYLEPEIVTKIAQERLNKLKNVQPLTAKRRLYAYLMRRGFSPEIVMDVVNQLCKQTY